MLLQLGIPVSCSDGLCGELSDVMVDPAARRVTQLVVQPHHHHALGRLVPVGLVAASDTPASPLLRLRCTTGDLHRLDPVDDPRVPVTYDAVPGGEVELRATSAVRSMPRTSCWSSYSTAVTGGPHAG